MNTPIGHTLKILHDDDATSPRDNDNLGTFAGWHRRYTLGDVQPSEQPVDYRDSLPKDSLIVPVYMLDHSGVALSIRDFGDPWDSGQVGFYHMTPEQIVEAFEEDTPATRQQALEGIKNEIAEYSDYLNGECWGYVVEDAEGNEVEACWGFIGRDVIENGLAHNLSVEYFPLLEEAADQAGLSCNATKLEELKQRTLAHQAAQRSALRPG